MYKLSNFKILAIIGLLFLIQQTALSYEYKLYDTQTKKSYLAQMITVEAPKKHFYLGLYAPSSGKPMYCIIEDKNDIIIERKQDGLKYKPAVFDFNKKSNKKK